MGEELSLFVGHIVLMCNITNVENVVKTFKHDFFIDFIDWFCRQITCQIKATIIHVCFNLLFYFVFEECLQTYLILTNVLTSGHLMKMKYHFLLITSDKIDFLRIDFSLYLVTVL